MAQPIRMEMTVPADTASLYKVRQAVLDLVANSAFPAVKANLMALAVDEAVANIIEHAYGVAEAGKDAPAAAALAETIQIILEVDDARFMAVVRDRGAGYDPRGAPDVDVQAHVRAGKRGGLGICLMRRIMDEIHYNFQDGHNELRMLKYVDEALGNERRSQQQPPQPYF